MFSFVHSAFSRESFGIPVSAARKAACLVMEKTRGKQKKNKMGPETNFIFNGDAVCNTQLCRKNQLGESEAFKGNFNVNFLQAMKVMLKLNS